MQSKRFSFSKFINRYNNLIFSGSLLLIAIGIQVVGLRVFSEMYYYKLFPFIRSVFDRIHRYIQFPLFYVIVILMIGVLFFYLYRIIKNFRNYYNYLHFLNYLLIVFIFFQLSWGINYKINPLEDFEDSVITSDSSILIYHFKNQTFLVNNLRKSIEYFPERNDIINMLYLDFEKKDKIFHDFNLLKTAPHSLKYLISGTFLNFNTAGMYFPFTGECLVDYGLHPLQLPSVASHEWFHASGVTDEGHCNFLAWLATTRYSDNRYIQYGGELDLWRDMAYIVRRIDPVLYSEILSHLNSQIVDDLRSISENSQRFSSRFDFIQRTIYNNYLKSQGVKEGVKSYGKVINYVLFYLEKERSETPY